MQSRPHFEHDLQSLQRTLVALGETAERAVVRAVWALQWRDIGAAQRVIAEEDAIDEARYSLEDQALRLIARQNPLATDLRAISALMGLASELERIGDYAEGIAEIALRLAKLPQLNIPAPLQEMASNAREMLSVSLTAVVARDASAAARQEESDDVVDALYQQVLQELLGTMRGNPDLCEPATYLLWAAHNIERIADRTVNITERAGFIATGLLAPPRRNVKTV